jgi:hypothetical protein
VALVLEPFCPKIYDGLERPVAYFSRSLNKHERNYCVTIRELLAVVESIKHFHHYLYGTQFKVRTDHGALNWLRKFKNPEGQIARWLEVLESYNFTIEHRPGKQHEMLMAFHVNVPRVNFVLARRTKKTYT